MCIFTVYLKILFCYYVRCNETAYRVECGLQLYRFKNYATLYMIGRRRIC
nr:MAG TPA: hypothetical protein [Caudoviricetes sp.]